MVQYAGTYQLVETVNPAEFLKVAGEEVTAEKLAGLTDTNSTFNVEVDGDNYVFTTTIGGGAWKREVKFTVGKPFQDGLNNKETATTTPTKEGDKIVFSSVVGGVTHKRYYAFSDGTVEMVLHPGTATEAKRIYKRV